MADGVLLVVVRDGMTEVNGVRGVGLQRVLELDADLSPDDLNAGQLLLWRSDDHVLRRFIDLNQFIENDLHASPLVVRLLRWRCTADKPGRLLVIRPTVRSRHIGARHSAPDQQSQPQSFHHVWHARLHSFIHPQIGLMLFVIIMPQQGNHIHGNNVVIHCIKHPVLSINSSRPCLGAMFQELGFPGSCVRVFR